MASVNTSSILRAKGSDIMNRNQQYEDVFINDRARFFLELILGHIFQLPVQSFGISTNVINIIVFLNIGLSDSLTVTLFGLSVADLFHLIFFFVFRVMILCMKTVTMETQLALMHVNFAIVWYSVYFNDVSMYLTVFSAIQKCCCVALPLRFKDMFTRVTGMVGTIAIYASTLAIILPIISAISFEKVSNTSFLQYGAGINAQYIRPHYQLSLTVWRWVNRVSLTFASEFVIVVCLVIIVVSLETSAKFRRSTQTGQVDGQRHEGPTIGKNELKAIRAVQMVSYIFVVTKIPSSIVSLSTEFIPEFSTPQYRNFRQLVMNLVYCTSNINASINIFVYIKYNSKYKRALFNMFGRQKLTNKDRQQIGYVLN